MNGHFIAGALWMILSIFHINETTPTQYLGCMIIGCLFYIAGEIKESKK